MKSLLIIFTFLLSQMALAGVDSKKIELVSVELSEMANGFEYYELPARHPRFMMVEMASQLLEIPVREAMGLVDYKWLGKKAIDDGTNSWGMMNVNNLLKYFGKHKKYTHREKRTLKRYLAILKGTGARYGYAPACFKKYQETCDEGLGARILFLDTKQRRIYSFQF